MPENSLLEHHDKEYSGIKTRVEIKLSLTSVQGDAVVQTAGESKGKGLLLVDVELFFGFKIVV